MKKGESKQVYEDHLLYCEFCPTQPEHFHEVITERINRVTPDAMMLIDAKYVDTTEYRCPNCLGLALWGWEFNR